MAYGSGGEWVRGLGSPFIAPRMAMSREALGTEEVLQDPMPPMLGAHFPSPSSRLPSSLLHGALLPSPLSISFAVALHHLHLASNLAFLLFFAYFDFPLFLKQGLVI